MLKSLYKKLLVSTLGRFIENFDEKNLDVFGWDGLFIADNLIIKKDTGNMFSEILGNYHEETLTTIYNNIINIININKQ